ncbi:MAG: M81 family metallopeptidase [Caldilineaceae bacterium]
MLARAGVPTRPLCRSRSSCPAKRHDHGRAAQPLCGPARAIVRHDLLDASLLVGYAWADEPRVAASAVAVAWDAPAAKTASAELAAAWWAQRAAFDFGMPTGTVEECIALVQAAVARRETPAFLSDAGDNITGGGVGDVPFVLGRMLAHGLENAVLPPLRTRRPWRAPLPTASVRPSTCHWAASSTPSTARRWR